MNARRVLIETLISALARELERRIPGHYLLADAAEFLAWPLDEAFELAQTEHRETRGARLVKDLTFHIKRHAGE